MADGIGEQLRSVRVEQGRTIQDAARETRIRSAYLVALEEERFQAIGGDVYAKGFLKTYATWLGMDPEPLLERYRKEVQGGYDPHALVDHPAGRQPDPTVPGWLVWGGIIALLLLAAFAVAGSVGSRSPTPAREVAPGGAQQAGSPSPVSPPPATVSPSPTPSPTPTGVKLLMRVEDRSWIQVTAGDEVVFQGTLEAGTSKRFANPDRLDLVLGNAGGVRLILNGRDLGAPAARGQVWRGMCTVDGCSAQKPS